MNKLLDSRFLPEQDALLIQHAQECQHCRSTLELQRRVFRCMQTHPVRIRRTAAPSWRTIAALTASAALVLLAVAFNTFKKTDAPTTTNRTPLIVGTDPPRPVEPPAPNLLTGLVHGDFSNLLPVETQLTDTAWLDQVSGGVKPLANSMTSTLNVLRKTWPSASPRNEGSHASPVTGAGTG